MDDEVLGCGGTIVKHVKRGDIVFVCFIANRIYDHKFNKKRNKFEMECALNAKSVLGYEEAKFFNLPDERLDLCIQNILIPLEKYINRIKPEIVYVNHRNDNHQDHRAVFQASMICLRPIATPYVKKILSYEVPSSTEQSPPFPDTVFIPNLYVDIEEELPIKIKALSCYSSEQRPFPHPRSKEAIEVLAKKRGSEIGMQSAEAFIMIRAKEV